ncbi:MAG: DUF2281 domain-containing protein [Firmicutes bacterium]|nr:DUF2281 domain-containing protein [Bacillota bacterium]
MRIPKEKIVELIYSLPEKELSEVIDFIGYLVAKRNKELLNDLLLASESCLDFWNNEIDDQVWDNE